MEAENATSSAMNTTDPYETYWWLAPKYFRQLSSRPKYLVAIESGIMLMITLTAFGGNALICLALVKKPRLRTATNLLILSLAVTDMLTACITHSVATIVLIKGAWIAPVNPLDVKNFYCQFQGIISPAFVAISVQIIALTGINRYICVTRSNLYKKVFSKRATRLMIFAVCTFVLTLTSVPYPAGLALITLDPRRALCFTTFKQPESAQTIASILKATNIGLPFAVVTLCCLRVFVIIRHSVFQVSPTTEGRASMVAARIKEMKITKTLLSVWLGFLVCWTPVVVCDYLSFKMTDPRFPRQGELVFTYFFALSSAINPFIYGTTNRALRKQLLGCN